MADDDHDFCDLRAVFVSCTLKRSPQVSDTEGLITNSAAIMAAHGVRTDTVRGGPRHRGGVQPDMTEHGAARDDWPALAEKVLAADILVLGTPIWRCEKSCVCTRVIERLYALSGRPTTPVSTSTTAASAGSWSPVMRTASSTWR